MMKTESLALDTFPGARYWRAMQGAVDAILIPLGIKRRVVSYGTQFKNRDAWTGEKFAHLLTAWLAKHPRQLPTTAELRDLITEANKAVCRDPYIRVAKMPERVTYRLALGIIGGGYHEAWHTKYSKRDAVCLDEVQPILDIAEQVTLAGGQFDAKMRGLLLTLHHLIEDIRIERRGNEDFEGAKQAMCDLQDFILSLETQARAKGAKIKNVTVSMNARSILLCAFRDLGLGYNTHNARRMIEFYKETAPDAIAMLAPGGLLHPMLHEAKSLAREDKMGSLRVAMKMVVELWRATQSDAEKPDCDLACPACGAGPKDLIIRSVKNEEGVKIKGLAELECKLCGYKTQFDLPDQSLDLNQPEEEEEDPDKEKPEVEDLDESDVGEDGDGFGDDVREKVRDALNQNEEEGEETEGTPQPDDGEEGDEESQSLEFPEGEEGDEEGSEEGDEEGSEDESEDESEDGEGAESEDDESEGTSDGSFEDEDNEGDDFEDGSGSRDEDEEEGDDYEDGDGTDDDCEDGDEGEEGDEGDEGDEDYEEGDEDGDEGDDFEDGDDSEDGDDFEEGNEGEDGDDSEDGDEDFEDGDEDFEDGDDDDGFGDGFGDEGDDSDGDDDSDSDGDGRGSGPGNENREREDDEWEMDGDEFLEAGAGGGLDLGQDPDSSLKGAESVFDGDEQDGLLNTQQAIEQALAEQEERERKNTETNEMVWNPYNPMLDEARVVRSGNQADDLALANKMLQEVRQVVTYLRTRLRTIVKAQEMTDTVHGVRRGRKMSERMLVDTVVDLESGRMPTRAYQITDTQMDTSIDMAICLDESWSMKRIRREVAKCMMVMVDSIEGIRGNTFAFGFRNGASCYDPEIPSHWINVYHRIAGVRYDVFKTWDEPFATTKWRFAHTQADGSTPMADGVQFGLQMLNDRRAAHRVLAVITDGQPDTPHDRVIRRQIRLARAAGIHVIGIGIGSSAVYVKTLFGETNSVWAPTVQDLPVPLLKKLNELCDFSGRFRGKRAQLDGKVTRRVS